MTQSVTVHASACFLPVLPRVFCALHRWSVCSRARVHMYMHTVIKPHVEGHLLGPLEILPKYSNPYPDSLTCSSHECRAISIFFHYK